MRRPLIAIAALLLAAGCASQPAPAVEPSSSVASASTGATTGALTREAAAAQYIASGDQLNKVIQATDVQCKLDRDFYTGDATEANPPAKRLANLKDCDAKVAKAMRDAVARTRALQWPTEVQADIEKLIKLNEAQAYTLERMAAAADEEEYLKLNASLPPDDGSADIVRARLGLPTRTKK